jgi:hypothetical protein
MRRVEIRINDWGLRAVRALGQRAAGNLGVEPWNLADCGWRIGREQAARCIYAAVDHGITLFDTAGAGEAERVLGEALRAYPRHRFMAATRLYFRQIYTRRISVKVQDGSERMRKRSRSSNHPVSRRNSIPGLLNADPKRRVTAAVPHKTKIQLVKTASRVLAEHPETANQGGTPLPSPGRKICA